MDTSALECLLVVQILLTGLTSVLGIVANIINIIVFTRQMKSENTSASLRGLSITDLLTVVASLWVCLNWTVILLEPPNLPWNPTDITYLFGHGPYYMCAQMTRMETAYVSFERCVCVVFPFKVKTIFTSKRTSIVTTFIVVICVFGNAPYFIVQWPEFVTDPLFNKTRLGVQRSTNWAETLQIVNAVNSHVLSIGSIIVVTFCTTITIIYIRLSKTWRESISHERRPSRNSQKSICTTSHSVSKRRSGSSVYEEKTVSKAMTKSKVVKEKRMIYMISLISAMFFISFTPNVVFILLRFIGIDLSDDDKYPVLGFVMFTLNNCMETFNSSLNIIVYYSMSTKFKLEFRRLLKLSEEKCVEAPK